MDFSGLSQRLKEVSGPRGNPIGIKYSNQPEGRGKSGKSFVCAAISGAQRGEIINLSAKNITCAGGMHWLGFEDYRYGLSRFLTYIEKFFKNIEISEHWFDTVPAPPRGKGEYVILSPLHICKNEPDLVVMVVNPRSAHLLYNGLIFTEGSLVVDNFFSATCQGAITNPIGRDRPSVVFPDKVSMKFGGFKDDEVLFSIPFRYIPALIESFKHTPAEQEELFKDIKELLKLIKKS